MKPVSQLNADFKAAVSELNGATIDCSSFTPVYDIAAMKMAEDDGFKHVLEFRGSDGTAYEGTTPSMVQTNALGFLQREAGIADARRRGWKPR
jgi:hypothetical protein